MYVQRVRELERWRIYKWRFIDDAYLVTWGLICAAAGTKDLDLGIVNIGASVHYCGGLAAGCLGNLLPP